MTGSGIHPTDTANTGTQSVKSAKPKTIREFERALLDLGFSKSESKAVASGGFKAIHPIVDELGDQLTVLMNTISGVQLIL